MKQEERETQIDEWRVVADRLASAMSGEKAKGTQDQTATTTAAVVESALRAVTIPAPTASAAGAARPPEVSVLGSVMQDVASVAKQLSGPLGWIANINPIFGLMRLFGGSSKQEPVELPTYERPARQNIMSGISAESGWAMRDVDYGAGWRHRPAGTAAEAATQITVQVQAIDSRSFIDHRDDIAAAVRQALLESHSLGDVLSDG